MPKGFILPKATIPKRTQAAPALAVETPPIGEGWGACVNWANSVALSLLGQPESPRIVVLRELLNAVATAKRIGADVETALTARQQHEGLSFTGTQSVVPPSDPMELPLWHAFALCRLVFEAAHIPSLDPESYRTRLKTHVAGLRVREIAETQALQKRHKISNLARAVDEYKDAQESMRQEAISEEEARAAQGSLLAFCKYMRKGFATPPHIQIIADHLEKLERGEIRRLIINCPPQHGKAIACDTPMLTTNRGWVTAGEVVVGDFLLGSRGQPTRVLHVWPQGCVPLYRVRFSDGASILACGEHLWQVHERRNNSDVFLPGVIMTTEALQASAWLLPDGRSRWRIPRATPWDGGIPRYITSITLEGEGEAVCFKVDSDDSLFCAGRELIVTHNSELCSRFFPAWFMGRNPWKGVIFCTYNQTYADKFGRQVRNFISRTVEFPTVFPHVRCADDSQAASDFEVVDTRKRRTVRGTYAARGQTVPTGLRAHLLIQDDLISEQDKESTAALEAAYEAIDAGYSRLQPKEEGDGWLIINTRYRLNDPVGYVLDKYKDESWTVLSFPALAEQDETFTLPDGTLWHRKKGDPLWEDRFTKEAMEARRNQLLQTSPPDWYGQYLCRPVPAEGAIIKMPWFDDRRYASRDEIMGRVQRVVLSLDTSKGGTSSARSAFTLWGEDVRCAYLLEVYAAPIPYPTLRETVKAWCRRWLPTALLIEDKSTGESLIQDLRNDIDWPRTPIFPIIPVGDKVTRMSVVTPMMAEGQVWMPAPNMFLWQMDYEKELMYFPQGAFKDQCDSTSQFLNWRREHPLMGVGDATWRNPTPAQQRLIGALSTPWGRKFSPGRTIMRTRS